MVYRVNPDTGYLEYYNSGGGGTTVNGSGSTSGAATDDLITLDMGSTSLVREITVSIAAFADDDLSASEYGAAYKIFGGVRTDGSSATLIGTPDKVVHEESAISACQVDLIVSGNNAIVRVTGIADFTITWKAFLTYLSAP